MSAAAAIAEREQLVFSRRLRAEIEQKFGTVSVFLRAVYGVDRKGKVKGAGSLYPALTGKRPANRQNLEAWAKAFGVTFEEISQWPHGPLVEEEPTTVAAARVGPKQLSVLREPPVPDQFSLVVSQLGRATLRLNLLDVPLQTALRAMAALTSVGLLSADLESRPGDPAP